MFFYRKRIENSFLGVSLVLLVFQSFLSIDCPVLCVPEEEKRVGRFCVAWSECDYCLVQIFRYLSFDYSVIDLFRSFSVDTLSFKDSIKQLIVYHMSFVRESEIGRLVFKSKDNIVLIVDNLVILILIDVQFLKLHILGPYYELISVLMQPHFSHQVLILGVKDVRSAHFMERESPNKRISPPVRQACEINSSCKRHSS